MPLSVETGSGSPSSDSYASLEQAAAYCTDYGLPWSGSDAAKEAALRRATRYIDTKYRSRFLGIRRFQRAQALEWPRVGAYFRISAPDAQDYYPSAQTLDYVDIGTVPVEVVRATIAVASQDVASPGTLITAARLEGELKTMKAGDHEKHYYQSTPETITAAVETQALAIEEILSELLSNESGYTSRAMRA